MACTKQANRACLPLPFVGACAKKPGCSTHLRLPALLFVGASAQKPGCTTHLRLSALLFVGACAQKSGCTTHLRLPALLFVGTALERLMFLRLCLPALLLLGGSVPNLGSLLGTLLPNNEEAVQELLKCAGQGDTWRRVCSVPPPFYQVAGCSDLFVCALLN